MASSCGRIFQRSSFSTIKSAISKPGCFSVGKSSAASARPSVPSNSASSSPLRRSCLSRIPVELGAAASMLPLHSVVAQTRMTSCLSASSRSCRSLSQDENDGT